MTTPTPLSELVQNLTADQFRQLQDAIGRQLLTTALPIVQSLLGRQVTEQDVQTLALTLFPAVEAARSASEDLAETFYRSQRSGHLRSVPPLTSVPTRTPYVAKYLARGLLRVVKPGAELTSVAQPLGTVVRHAEAAGRDHLQSLSLADKECKGWARRARGSRTCSFCTMLISRGPVYKSRESAGDMKKFHDFCDCQIVPVFDRKNFPGRQQYLDAQQLWADSTRGKSGKEALAAFRAANHAPDGQDAVKIAA